MERGSNQMSAVLVTVMVNVQVVDTGTPLWMPKS